MNYPLMEEIVRHVFCNLGIIPSSFVDRQKSLSLIDKEFMLANKLMFKNENGRIVRNAVYGCQIAVDQRDFKIIIGDCSQDTTPEYAGLIQLTGNPAYGFYLVCDDEIDSEVLIGVSVNEKDWMPCTTFLQATFLAAMEQLKDLNLGWMKCRNYQKSYEMLVSFISFHTSYYEVENEG